MTLIRLIHTLFCAKDAKHFQRRVDAFPLEVTHLNPNGRLGADLLLDNLDRMR